MKPLDKIRVLDFTHGVAGPYATMLLADLGCEVIKIEKPDRGDPTRYMNVSSRFASEIPQAGGDYFMAINRNKRSVTLDLKHEAGVRIARQLAATTDVVAQSFRPGVMEGLGLGEDTLRAENPGLVYASLTAYGDSGPLAGQPGMDVAVQARSGVMSITGAIDANEPVKPGVSLADFAGGTHLALSVLAALMRRSASGKGGSVRLALLDATMAMLINYSVAVIDGSAQLRPMGSGHPQLAPFEAMPTSDGHIVIAPGTNRLFKHLCQLLDRADLAADERFRSNESRVQNRQALLEHLHHEFRKHTTTRWLEVLESASIPCAPVNTLHEAFADPELRANDMVLKVDHPNVGALSQLRSPYRFDGELLPVLRPPPLLGQHTTEVLRQLGITEERIGSLRRQGVV